MTRRLEKKTRPTGIGLPAERVARLAIYNVIGGCTLYIQREVGVDVVYTTYILNITNAYLMRYTVYYITI